MNLSKEVKDFYDENYRTLMKEVKRDINKWKDIPCSWIGRLNIAKTQCYPKQSTVSTQSPSKFQ